MSGGFFNGVAHVIFAVEVEYVGNEVESMLVVVHFDVEAGEIESVGKIFFVDLAKVLIAAGGDKLCEWCD